MSDLDLHPDRLATTDEKGNRIYLYVADVKGFFRKQRIRVQAVLLVFFLVLPWMRINGAQAVLLDISRRQFEIFGLSLRAHNAPLLFLVFAVTGFGLFFVTAVWGRIWCGWACPQTVFVDGVFRRIERWIEGSHLERRKLDQSPWSVKKIFKRVSKWTLFIVASLIITHSFLAYFVGTDRLALMVRSSPFENWGSFLFILGTTSLVLFDFAWFREQFCTIVCPYGRFQSVLMDEHSLIVAYDQNRGEPRATPAAKIKAQAIGEKMGDCVNCYRCVQVCPAGIDIRRGLQMECIACTACIDACADIMTKLKRPTGLIRYDSQVNMAQVNVSGGRRKFWRPRVIVYLAALLVASSALATFILTMKPVDIVILRAKDTPYTVDREGVVLNHFKVDVSNQSGTAQKISFPVNQPSDLQIISAQNGIVIESEKYQRLDLFVRFPKKVLSSGKFMTEILITHKNLLTQETVITKKEMTLVGPFN